MSSLCLFILFFFLISITNGEHIWDRKSAKKVVQNCTEPHYSDKNHTDQELIDIKHKIILCIISSANLTKDDNSLNLETVKSFGLALKPEGLIISDKEFLLLYDKCAEKNGSPNKILNFFDCVTDEIRKRLAVTRARRFYQQVCESVICSKDLDVLKLHDEVISCIFSRANLTNSDNSINGTAALKLYSLDSSEDDKLISKIDKCVQESKGNNLEENVLKFAICTGIGKNPYFNEKSFQRKVNSCSN